MKYFEKTNGNSPKTRLNIAFQWGIIIYSKYFETKMPYK